MKQIITHYSDGKVFVQYNEDENEQKQGTYVKYFNNPHVVKESHNYVDNVLHGEFLKYKMVSDKQMLVLHCNYKHGKLDGIYQTWCKDSGKPLTIVHYKDGKKDGEYLEYYPNGQLFRRYKYVNDKIICGSKSWFKSGKLETEFIDKTCIKYDDNNKVQQKTIFDNNYNTIKIIKYDTKGIIEEEQEYKNGQNVKRIFFNHDWYEPCFRTRKVTKIADFETKIQTVIPNKTPNERIIYDLQGNYIRTEFLDKHGNVIPSTWSRMKEFLCPKKHDIKKYIQQDDNIEEKVELIDKKRV
jgi:antitoxin component YwqK of YwqJK toxin-antitoxin module